MVDIKQCDNHDEHTRSIAEHGARIAQLEKQDDKLFSILDEHTKTLSSINSCMRQISSQIENIEKTFARKIVDTNNTVAINKKELEDMKDTVDEIAEFAWFRTKVTWVRDNVFWTLAGLLALSIGGLMVLHTASNKFVDILLKWATK